MHDTIAAQRRYFLSHATLEVEFRLKALSCLRKAILKWEPRLVEALRADLGKSSTESYMSEIGMVLAGLRDVRRHLRRWARGYRVMAPPAQFPSTCRVVPEPYGVSLVISPWNYPVLLALDPLVGALAAGNTCVLKPSELAPATAEVLGQMLAETFPPEYVAVVQGGVEVSNALLAESFDYIFFTGSPRVGHIVMEAAARHLTPLTLELGGKSPCIVDETADVRMAARRIAFGKILNVGQTCVAPDYALVHINCKGAFINAFREEVEQMLGEEPLKNPNYPCIINERHFERIVHLMKVGVAMVGGKADAATRRIEPTLLVDVPEDAPCMQEEIFGPLLPVITYESIEEVENFILSRPKPLACYIFTGNRMLEKRLLKHLSFGGGCVNDTIIHLAVPGLPFGGVGNSGMGAYHGKASFDTFSHKKSVLRKGTWLDLPFRYQPFTRFKELILRLFLR